MFNLFRLGNSDCASSFIRGAFTIQVICQRKFTGICINWNKEIAAAKQTLHVDPV